MGHTRWGAQGEWAGRGLTQRTFRTAVSLTLLATRSGPSSWPTPKHLEDVAQKEMPGEAQRVQEASSKPAGHSHWLLSQRPQGGQCLPLNDTGDSSKEAAPPFEPSPTRAWTHRTRPPERGPSPAHGGCSGLVWASRAKTHPESARCSHGESCRDSRCHVPAPLRRP